MAEIYKTENGKQYSAAAYLYVPDPEHPSTWKLRIEEEPGVVTVAQLGRAAAALSPAGFRGRRVRLPPAARQRCAKRLLELYREHGVADDEIPPYLFRLAGEQRPQTKALVVPAALTVRAVDAQTRWLLVTSGAFVDREGEIVSTAFLRDAVDFAQKSGYRGTLNFWHLPGSDIGTCDFQALIGEPPFLLESGLFDDTPAGRAAARYCQENASELGASLEFVFRQKENGVYLPPGVIIRRSILPRRHAAFPWSELMIKEQKMQQEVIAELAKLLGIPVDEAEKIYDHLVSRSHTLRELGVQWKENGAVASEEEPDVEETLEAVLDEATLAQIADQVIERLTPLMDGFNERIAQLEQQVQALQVALTELRQADEEKIAQAVRSLPHATLRYVQRNVGLRRPTQSQTAAVPETTLAELAQRALYG